MRTWRRGTAVSYKRVRARCRRCARTNAHNSEVARGLRAGRRRVAAEVPKSAQQKCPKVLKVLVKVLSQKNACTQIAGNNHMASKDGRYHCCAFRHAAQQRQWAVGLYKAKLKLN